jgi:hypothetical protein
MERIEGRISLRLGDEPITPLIHQARPDKSPIADYAGFAQSGLRVQTAFVDLGVVSTDPENHEFAALERSLLEAIDQDPNVSILLVVKCDIPREWGVARPGDVWTAESGAKWILLPPHTVRSGEELREGETFTASYGSTTYRDAMTLALGALGRFVRSRPAGRIVCGFMLVGGCDGQWFDCSLPDSNLLERVEKPPTPVLLFPFDQSLGQREGLRSWLRQQYGESIAALREAWRDANVSFADATISGELARYKRALFRNPSTGQVADSTRYAHLAPVNLVKHFVRVLKESIGRPVVAVTYYPDLATGMGINKYALGEMFSGDGHPDAMVSVPWYAQWRRLGGSGNSNSAWGSHRLNGTLAISEFDYRTYLSSAPNGLEELGAPGDAAGFLAQVRRDVGAAASRGMGAWFYDMGGGWYYAPNLMSTISEASKILTWAHRPAAPAPSAEMAVFLDETAAHQISPYYFHVLNSAASQQYALNMSGVPYDLYRSEDILNAELPDYKVYIFLNPLTVTRSQVTAIRERCRRPGKVLVVTSNIGFGSPDYKDPRELAADLLGIRCEYLPQGSRTASIPISSEGQSLVAGLSESFAHRGTSDGYLLASVDKDVTVLGKYLFTDMPSHVVKYTENGVVVLVPPCHVASLTPRFVHNIARTGGIRTLGTPGQVTYVGSGVAVCHRIQPGPATVHFDRAVDLMSISDGNVLASGVTEWEPSCGLLETDIVLYAWSSPPRSFQDVR